MKKKLLVFLCISFAALAALAGCKKAPSSESVSSSAPASESVASSVSSVPASSSSAVSPESEAESPFDQMMTALSSFQPGTAGSSLKQYIAACSMLNYSEQYDSSQADQLRADLDTYLANADETQLLCITEGRMLVEDTAQEILTKGVDSVADILADAGNPQKYDSYDAEKYAEVSAILDEALAALSQ